MKVAAFQPQCILKIVLIFDEMKGKGTNLLCAAPTCIFRSSDLERWESMEHIKMFTVVKIV